MDGRFNRSVWQHQAPYDKDEPCQRVHTYRQQQESCDALRTAIRVPLPPGTNAQLRLQRCFQELSQYFGRRHYGHANDYLGEDRLNYHNDWPPNNLCLPDQKRRMHYDDSRGGYDHPSQDMACSDNGFKMYHCRRNNAKPAPSCTSINYRQAFNNQDGAVDQKQTLHWNAHSDNTRGENQICTDFKNLNVRDEEPTTSRLTHNTMGKCEYGTKRRYTNEMISQPNATGCTDFRPGKPWRHGKGMFDGFGGNIGQRNITTSGVEQSKLANPKKGFTLPLPDAQVYFPWNESLPPDILSMPVSEEELESIKAEDGWACGFVHEPYSNLRPVVIDGSNVAMTYYSDGRRYSALAISHAVEYFLRRGHPVVAMLSRGHLEENSPYKMTDGHIFLYLLSRQLVVLTPVIHWNSRKGPMRCTPYEDHFIAEQAYVSGGIIVSNDSFKDVAAANPPWKAMLLNRVIRFGWDKDGNFELRSKGDPLSEWELEKKLFFNKNEKVYQVVKSVSEEEKKEILSNIHRIQNSENVTS